jgi:uncharacterized small protein (DUF1192 family)
MSIEKRIFFDADTGTGGVSQAPATTEGDTGKAAATTPPKTYTEEEVNGLLARKQSEQVDRMLKDLGIESSGTLKERIAALKKYEDEHKTEIQKEKEARTAAETRLQEAQTRADKAEAKAEALAVGVPAAKAERFVKIAMTYEGETVAEKVAAAIKDNPEFRGETAPEIPNANTKVKSQGSPEADKVRAAFNAALGLKTP